MLVKYFFIVLTALLAGGVFQSTLAQKPKVSKPPQSTVKTPAGVAPLPASLLPNPEQRIFDEINLARTNPAAYVKFLESFRPRYKGNEIHFPDGHVLVTNEGIKGLEEAIRFLRTQKPGPAFEIRKGLVLAAKTHVSDLDSTGKSGHTGSDGSKPQDRFSRYGTWVDSVGENIVYDSRNARDDVIGIVIDDGVANRGHRNNLFKPNFRVIGIAVGQKTKRPTIAVITFAGGFVDKR